MLSISETILYQLTNNCWIKASFGFMQNLLCWIYAYAFLKTQTQTNHHQHVSHINVHGIVLVSLTLFQQYFRHISTGSSP